MFSELGDGQRLWLIALWLIWASLLFGGFIFGKLNADDTHRIPRWARMASSLTLVVAAWSWFAFAGQTEIANHYSLFIAIGMTLGFIGDLFMAQLIPLKDYVLGGIGSFGLGHIAYIIGLVGLGNASQLFADSENARWGALVVWWLIALASWYVVVFRGQKHSFLHYAALPYALLLASTAGLATGLAIQEPLFIPLAIGTALFLLSDLTLAAQLFNGLHFRMIGDVVWLTYGPAQMLIVYSVANAIIVALRR